MPRLRISSIEVTEITDDLIKILSDSNPLVPHLHIPLQSGSDSILKRMNRPYSAADYLKRIEAIRERLPEIAITTDIIVGFPGESENDFQASYTLAHLAGFSEMHIFPYSTRKGTQAEHFTDEVPHDIKKRRVHELIALNQRLAQDYIQSKKTSKLQVVVEQYRSGMLIGHSREYIHIQFPGPKEYIGREVDVDLVHEEYPLSLGRLSP
jgi:threonylcarbamoyladenosine tRNA methylthiotransferase MtaB